MYDAAPDISNKLIDITMYIKNTIGQEITVLMIFFSFFFFLSEVSELIFNRKDVYHNQLAQTLNDPKTSSLIMATRYP